MSVGLQRYDAKTKTNWRGWQWNRIVERLSVPAKDALVLYLCGPEDIDRAHALKRGFKNQNLIAVDIELSNVERVRDGGNLAICAGLASLVAAWPADWPIDLIIADFCGGWDHRRAAFIESMAVSRGMAAQGRPPVVSVNIQRGRDPFTNAMRAEIAAADTDGFFDGLYGVDTRVHRGYFAFLWAAHLSASTFHRAGLRPNDTLTASDLLAGNPAFNSYTSTQRTYFDSAIFKWNSVEKGLWDTLPSNARGIARGEISEDVATALPQLRAAVKPLIAACRAVRTAKMRRSTRADGG